MSGEEPIDLVATVHDLDPVVVTLRDVLHRSGALRVVVIVDREEPAIVDVGRLAPVEVQVGERLVHVPHAMELDAEPIVSPELRQLPPFEVDAAAGEVIGTIGGLDHLADAMRELSRALGGASVAMAQYATTTPDLPLSVTARGDEPVVVSIGEDAFELPERGDQ
jgi:hypothetical protein